METGYTYLIEQQDKYKIGFTTDLGKRMSQYKTHNCDFKLLYVIRGNIEKELHNKFKEYKVYTEWFNADIEILSYFKENGESVFIGEKDLILNANLFCIVCDELSGQAIKLFIVIMKYALYDEKGEGNLFYTSDIHYKQDIEHMKLKKNISRTLKELCDKGLLHRINNGVYRLNPQIAYAGQRINHAKLILNIKNKLQK